MEKWVKFARQNGFAEFPPDAKQFSSYITTLSEQGASFLTIKLLQSSMPFYYAARDSEALVVTKRLNKCETNTGEEEIKSFLTSVFWSTGSRNNPNPSLKDWRTATRIYTYYFTLCRFDCYSKLKKNSREFLDDHVVIEYPTRKNDQVYSGSQSVLKLRDDPLCPKLIFKTYFKIMQFKSDSDTLNCRLSFSGKTSRPTTQLAYSQALKDTKELTESFGYDGVTEKSFKASGVTVLLDKNTPLHDVQVYSNWKSLETPMYYHNWSTGCYCY